MTDRSNETYDQLLLMVGEVHSDTKHILRAQATRDKRTQALEDRMTVLERFRWKIVGIATAIPVVLTAAGMWLSNSGGQHG